MQTVPVSRMPLFSLFFTGYNLHEPGYNLHESGYNLHEPEYNPNELEYNPNEPCTVTKTQEGLFVGF